MWVLAWDWVPACDQLHAPVPGDVLAEPPLDVRTTINHACLCLFRLQACVGVLKALSAASA